MLLIVYIIMWAFGIEPGGLRPKYTPPPPKRPAVRRAMDLLDRPRLRAMEATEDAPIEALRPQHPTERVLFERFGNRIERLEARSRLWDEMTEYLKRDDIRFNERVDRRVRTMIDQAIRAKVQFEIAKAGAAGAVAGVVIAVSLFVGAAVIASAIKKRGRT